MKTPKAAGSVGSNSGMSSHDQQHQQNQRDPNNRTRMDGPKEHPVNFYFGSAEDMAEVKKKDNSSQEYLILQNNQLFSENAKLRSRVERVKSEKEVLNADYDNMERTKTCLKGLLHNEVEINEIQKEIRTIQAKDLVAMRRTALGFAVEIIAALACLAGTVALDMASKPEHEKILWMVQTCLCAGTAASALVFAASVDSTNVAPLEESLKDAQKASSNLHCIIDEI